MENRTLSTVTEEALNITIPVELWDDNYPVVLVSGKAGTGKSTLIKYLLEKKQEGMPEGKHWGVKTSTTGISACNINGITVHSLLGVYDTDSWVKAYTSEKLHNSLATVSDYFRAIIVDEIYMLGARPFDILVASLLKFNRENPHKPLRLIMTGDAGQLPPVNDKPIFEGGAWGYITHLKLEKVHRQSDPAFIEALNHLRNGEGELALDYFQNVIGFNKEVSKTHPGVILYGTNRDVDTENWNRLQELRTPEFTYSNMILDKVSRGRDEDILARYYLPSKLVLKEGAPVMCLVNQRQEGFANGDLGFVQEFEQRGVWIKLLRNNAVVYVQHILQKDAKGNQLRFMPLRVAFASTYHKMQSMTTDSAQVVLAPGFIAKTHGAIYTGLTRVRTPQGLRLVCSGPKDFLSSVYVNKQWLQYM